MYDLHMQEHHSFQYSSTSSMHRAQVAADRFRCTHAEQQGVVAMLLLQTDGSVQLGVSVAEADGVVSASPS